MPIKVEFSVTEKGKKAPEYTIESDLQGEVSLKDFLDFTKSNLILIADQVLREEQAKGFDKNPVVTVDGRVGKPVINVNPLGSITFTARSNAKDMMLEIYRYILDKSPVDTGNYISNNIVFFNGGLIAKSYDQLAEWFSKDPKIGDNDFFRFVNTAPYARKLERFGVSAGRMRKNRRERRQKSRDKEQRSGAEIRAPNGAYYLAAKSANRKYRNNAKIYFNFIPGSQITFADKTENESFQSKKFKTPSRASRQRRPPRSPSTYLYPCIKVYIVGAGIL